MVKKNDKEIAASKIAQGKKNSQCRRGSLMGACRGSLENDSTDFCDSDEAERCWVNGDVTNVLCTIRFVLDSRTCSLVSSLLVAVAKIY